MLALQKTVHVREMKATLMDELPKYVQMGKAVLYCKHFSMHQMSWCICAYPCRDMSPGRKLAILA